jgi:predicted nucleic acid-binding protein
MLLNASIDTSFWNIAARVGVVPYLFEFFRIHYCQAVYDDVVTTNPQETALVYPQAMLFQLLREDGRLHHVDPLNPLTRFGKGEAHALALAQERGWVLLINDVRPLTLATNFGIPVVSVPAICVLLAAEGRITSSAASGYLRRLRPTTSPRLIEQAERVIDALDRANRGKS